MNPDPPLDAGRAARLCYVADDLMLIARCEVAAA